MKKDKKTKEKLILKKIAIQKAPTLNPKKLTIDLTKEMMKEKTEAQEKVPTKARMKEKNGKKNM